jgi:hypothetical protein
LFTLPFRFDNQTKSRKYTVGQKPGHTAKISPMFAKCSKLLLRVTGFSSGTSTAARGAFRCTRGACAHPRVAVLADTFCRRR